MNQYKYNLHDRTKDGPALKDEIKKAIQIKISK